MMSLCLWSVLVFSAVLSTVSSQESNLTRILSRVDPTEGPQNFTITCGTKCFENTTDVVGTQLVTIRISFEGTWQNGSTYSRIVRDFNRLEGEGFVGTRGEIYRNRDWYVREPGNSWMATTYYNVYTHIVLNDVVCEDVGYYDCALTLIRPNGTVYRKSRGQYMMFAQCPQTRWIQDTFQG